mmetsp:Transcript_22558/g.89223  ORF Transcript_22558/g.89223 Transcript_22558/m.89223 type:complete len:221 (+) Transcript_22558:1810-2472(+)
MHPGAGREGLGRCGDATYHACAVGDLEDQAAAGGFAEEKPLARHGSGIQQLRRSGAGAAPGRIRSVPEGDGAGALQVEAAVGEVEPGPHRVDGGWVGHRGRDVGRTADLAAARSLGVADGLTMPCGAGRIPHLAGRARYPGAFVERIGGDRAGKEELDRGVCRWFDRSTEAQHLIVAGRQLPTDLSRAGTAMLKIVAVLVDEAAILIEDDLQVEATACSR